MFTSFIYKALDKDHQTNKAHGQKIAYLFRLKQVRRENNIMSLTIAFLTERSASEFINRVEGWKTIRMDNNEFTFLGWEGHKSILLPSDWKKVEAKNRFMYYLGQILNILSQWAVFSGVGNKTSYGLGAVEIG